ncbi:MAG: hypothetical protein MJ185_02590 [Treponema sp.]|nr:hypothetical protein [Treponema sp.]
MDILSETPFKILHQGFTDTIVEYKNIETDLPQNEQDSNEFSSAESYNQERRSKHSEIPSYKLENLSDLYKTREFKEYKIEQIIQVTEYLLKVLKLIFSIDKQIFKVEKKIDGVISEKKFPTGLEKEIYRSRLIIEDLLDLLSDLKVSIIDLETDPYSVRIDDSVKEIWDSLLLSLTICYVPDELASKVDILFPGIALKKFSNLYDKKAVLHHFFELKDRLFRIINLFIKNLSDQFSFYVTSDQFLNNPAGRTIFVIPMSMYILFDFSQSGLNSAEVLKKDSKSLYSIDVKQMKFFRNVECYLKDLLEEACCMKQRILNEKEFFNIRMLLDCYEKKIPNIRIKPLEQYFSDPVVFEKMTDMVQKVKQPMVSAMTKGGNPWDIMNPVTESKDIDNSTIYFLLKLHEMRFGDSVKLPQSQLRDLLNLCSYSARSSCACMNEHVSRYRKGKYRVSASFEALFQPILMG